MVCFVPFGLLGATEVALETEDEGVSADSLFIADDDGVTAIEDGAPCEKVKPLDDCGIMLLCDGIGGLESLSR